jgi:cytoskeletal protein RodZ
MLEQFLAEDMLQEKTAEEAPVAQQESSRSESGAPQDDAAYPADKQSESDTYTDDFDEEEEEEESRSNVFLIALLVVVIVALLAVTGFIFVKYFLPNLGSETVPPTTQAAPTTEALPTATTIPTIPCESLVLTSGGTVELTKPGQNWLLNVIVLPEDTTDVLTYSSSNPAVAVVNEDGRVTAVGEGETVITISCGSEFVECVIICSFVQETEPVETEPVETEATEDPNETEEDPVDPSATEPADPSQGTEPAATEPAATEPNATEPPATEPPATEPPATEPPATEPQPTQPADGIVLTLSATDLTFKIPGVWYQLKVTEGLDVKDVQWITTDSSVASVYNGMITVMGPGTCTIIARYQGQEVRCVIRCYF